MPLRKTQRRKTAFLQLGLFDHWRLNPYPEKTTGQRAKYARRVKKKPKPKSFPQLPASKLSLDRKQRASGERLEDYD